MRVLSIEWARYNIKTTAIASGLAAIYTDLNRRDEAATALAVAQTAQATLADLGIVPRGVETILPTMRDKYG